MARPPKIKSPTEMAEKIEAYFAWCDANPVLVENINTKGNLIVRTKPRPYTMAGLALYVGFDDKKSFCDYRGAQDHVRKTAMSAEEKANREAYSYSITRALSKIEEQTVSYSKLGVFDSRISALVLATHHGYNAKAKDDGEQNFTINFVSAVDEKKRKEKAEKA